MDVKQRVALGALGVGYVALRTVLSHAPVIHERLADDAALLAWNRDLAGSLSELMRVTSDTDHLMALVHAFRTHEQSGVRTASIHMTHRARDIERELTRLMTATHGLTSEQLRQTLYVEQDVVPVIRERLEGLIHNCMLASLI